MTHCGIPLTIHLTCVEILNVQFNVQYLHAAQMNFISDVSFSNFVIYLPFLGVWLSSALSNHCFLFQITQLTRMVHHHHPGTWLRGVTRDRVYENLASCHQHSVAWRHGRAKLPMLRRKVRIELRYEVNRLFLSGSKPERSYSATNSILHLSRVSTVSRAAQTLLLLLLT